MHYSFYLFVQLRTLILGEPEAYDIQFGIDQTLFVKYEKSKYNVAELPEYECMVNFLKAYKDGEAIYTIGDLRNAIAEFDDNDALLVEIHEGERGEDLYTPKLDVIGRVNMANGTTIREVRLCI